MVNRHYAIITKEYKLIHYYFAADEWELIDRKKDPMEMKNFYNDPAYRKVKKDLHAKLERLRKKYKDSSNISQRYIDEFMKDAADGKVYGVSEEMAEQILERKRR